MQSNFFRSSKKSDFYFLFPQTYRDKYTLTMRKQKTKFVFLQIGVRTGEYEFNSKGTHELHYRTNITKFAQKYAKGFYSGRPFQYDKPTDPDGEWYFNGGEVCAWVDRVEEITKEQYEVLSRFVP